MVVLACNASTKEGEAEAGGSNILLFIYNSQNVRSDKDMSWAPWLMLVIPDTQTVEIKEDYGLRSTWAKSLRDPISTNKKVDMSQVPGDHTYNPSYLGSRDHRIVVQSQPWANSL
jgi:hypothetical protein